MRKGGSEREGNFLFHMQERTLKTQNATSVPGVLFFPGNGASTSPEE
jgi:hypothetical protein